MSTEIIPAADFEKLPLEMIVATPLTAAVKAQQILSHGTIEFIKSMMTKDEKTEIYEPQTIDFVTKYEEKGGTPISTNKQIQIPLLSIVPIPHLRIDSITTQFHYEISQIVAEKKEIEKGLCGEATVGHKLLPFLNATLKGNVSSKSSVESTTNRSGVLNITVHAGEAAIPEGLARMLSILAKMSESKP